MTELRQRQPRVEDKAFLAFVRRRRCCGCGEWPPVQAAHLRGACPERDKRQTGKGEKSSDRWTVPLCARCHLDAPDSLHRTSEETFFRRIGIDPFAMADALYAEFSSSKSNAVSNESSSIKGAVESDVEVKLPTDSTRIGKK